MLEAATGFEPVNSGFADRPLRPLGYAAKKNGAGDGTRTRDINLGKVALYQLSYSRSHHIILHKIVILSTRI